MLNGMPVQNNTTMEAIDRFGLCDFETSSLKRRDFSTIIFLFTSPATLTHAGLYHIPNPLQMFLGPASTVQAFLRAQVWRRGQ